MDFKHFDRTMIIAELSCNHLHQLDLAMKTIEAMAEAGADVVKVQNDNMAEDMLTIDCDNEYFRINQGTLWDGETLYSLYKKTETPLEWLPLMQEKAHSLGMQFFSTPSDPTSVDLLETLNVPAYKISSFEITDLQLIRRAAETGKPVLISTGIATEEDIRLAIETCHEVGNNDVILLKCTSSYPASIEAANLTMIHDMKERFGCQVGLSDHSMGDIVATTAVALGAVLIEKHFILDRNLGGPDGAFSMEPQEFKQMVERVRDAEKTIGKVSYELSEETKKNRNFAKSLFVIKDVKKGDIIDNNNVRAIRPGYGLLPKHWREVEGKVFTGDYKRGTPFGYEMIQ